MRNKLILCTLLFFNAKLAMAFTPEEGAAIFKSRCAGCHNVNQVLTGPALAGVDARRTIEWITSFVQSSQGMIRKGDPQANELFQKFNKIIMPDHPDLNADHVKSIVSYIKSETVSTSDKAAFKKPYKQQRKFIPLSLTRDAGYFIAYLVVVGILITSLIFAVRIRELRREQQAD